MKTDLDIDYDFAEQAPAPLAQEDIAAVTESLRGLAPSLDTYTELESIHVRKCALEVLNGITPDKVAGANLRDLVTAYKLLKEKDLLLQGRPTELTGIMHLVVSMEKKFEGKEEDPSSGVAGASADQDAAVELDESASGTWEVPQL